MPSSVQKVKGSGIATVEVRVAVAAWIWFLAWELLCAVDAAIKLKKKEKMAKAQAVDSGGDSCRGGSGKLLEGP